MLNHMRGIHRINTRLCCLGRQRSLRHELTQSRARSETGLRRCEVCRERRHFPTTSTGDVGLRGRRVLRVDGRARAAAVSAAPRAPANLLDVPGGPAGDCPEARLPPGLVQLKQSLQLCPQRLLWGRQRRQDTRGGAWRTELEARWWRHSNGTCTRASKVANLLHFGGILRAGTGTKARACLWLRGEGRLPRRARKCQWRGAQAR
mmetsp:Transcript_44782/g.143460  ORF Transcript_44782/g.143460 Transcript_44782/m.143460 type:complete len:205 (+) Transcript_44782:40-654(+)